VIILDTTACIDYLNGNEKLKDTISKQEDLVNITTISVYEINIGLERTKRKISEERFKMLNKIWMEFISGMEIISLGFKEAVKAAEIYDRLESIGQRIDDNDILIAGIMLANGMKVIVTKNIKHFERIEGIEIVNY